jgi:hypothetical protein
MGIALNRINIGILGCRALVKALAHSVDAPFDGAPHRDALPLQQEP